MRAASICTQRRPVETKSCVLLTHLIGFRSDGAHFYTRLAVLLWFGRDSRDLYEDYLGIYKRMLLTS